MVVRSPQRPQGVAAVLVESTRRERVFLRLEERGVAGRVAAGALHRAVIAALWARRRHPCVILERALTGELPRAPLPSGVTIAPFDGVSDEPLAGLWTATESAHMRAHLRQRMQAGMLCLAAWEDGRIVAYDLLGPSGAEDVRTLPGTCFALDLHERRSSRGRGVCLALLAAALPYTLDLGCTRLATTVPARNRAMIAAATELLGFTVTGDAERTELLGRVRWTWPLHGSICSGPRLLV
jgi:GNAT superfamily N-acetyltransferase